MRIGNLDLDVTESGVVPHGTKLKVNLLSVSLRYGKDSGLPYLLCKLEPVGEDPTELYNYFYHSLFLPTDEDDERRAAKNIAKLKNFFSRFGVSWEEVKRYIVENESEAEPRPMRVEGSVEVVLGVKTYEGVDSNYILRM